MELGILHTFRDNDRGFDNRLLYLFDALTSVTNFRKLGRITDRNLSMLVDNW